MYKGRSENILLMMVLVVGCLLLLTKRDKRPWDAVCRAEQQLFHSPAERYTVTLCLYIYDEDTVECRIVTKLPEDKVRKKVACSQRVTSI